MDKPLLVCVVTEVTALHDRHPVEVAIGNVQKLLDLGACGSESHLREARLVRVTVEYLP